MKRVKKAGPNNACKHASAACRQGLSFVGRKRMEEKMGENKRKNWKKEKKKW